MEPYETFVDAKKFKEKLNELYDLIDENRMVDTLNFSSFTKEVPKITGISLNDSDLANKVYNNYKIAIDENFKLSIKDSSNNNDRVLTEFNNLFSFAPNPTPNPTPNYTLENLINYYNYLVDYNGTNLDKKLDYNITYINISTGSHFYVIDVLKYYYFLIILYCFLLILKNQTSITDENELTDENEFYKSLNHLISIYMQDVQNNKPTDTIYNYNKITSKISKSSNAYVNNNKLIKSNLKDISDNKKILDYLYRVIVVILILTIVILSLSIYFRNNVKYISIGLLAIIILNVIFSSFVKVPYVEKFYNDANICDYSELSNEINKTKPINLADKIYVQLCKLACGLHFRHKDGYVASLYYGVRKLEKEKYRYGQLKLESKGQLLRNKASINNDILTFYQRKEYTSLFIRLVTLLVVLLILSNLFDESMIKIFGFIFFCLIFMVYLYNLKIINRVDTNKRYWNNIY